MEGREGWRGGVGWGEGGGGGQLKKSKVLFCSSL